MPGSPRLSSSRLARAAAAAAATVSLVAAGGPAVASSQLAGHVTVSPDRPQVPWSRVGPGWELVLYTSTAVGSPSRPAPTTLNLVSPGGRRYQLYRWRSGTVPPALLDWSGDKTRALLGLDNGKLEQITLATGAASIISLPRNAQILGYTRPSGRSLLAAVLSGRRVRFGRYSQHGALQRQLADVKTDNTSLLVSPGGGQLVIGTGSGLVLVSSAGHVVRWLPVHPQAGGCNPVRYWTAGTVLASCATTRSGPRLWLVPVDGSRAATLTPVRSQHGPDLGDIGAWRLHGALYVQATGPCGDEFIARQHRNGSVSVISVPGARANDNHIFTAHGGRFLVLAQTGCIGSNSLLWFNPRTRAEQWLFRTPKQAEGVVGVMPYYSRQNQPIL
jgi:hypothetical protein